MSRIFISIASYRDHETNPTIRDLLEKADNPKNITIGLCLQHDTNINEIKIDKYDNIKLLEYDWRESQGTCWARHNIQKFLFDNEKYYMQLDSHHRFCKSWDSILIDIIESSRLKHNKPIIGGYCPGYEPNNDQDLEDHPMQINCFPDFTDLGDLLFQPKTIRNYKEIQTSEKTIPARFLSGHFIFTDGIFCNECQYDPNMYFRGEELTLSARAYTSGYDLIHPTVPIVWHEYGRKKAIKHWDDHIEINGFLTTAKQRSNKGKERARYLLGIEKKKINFGKYGLGSLRSLHEYELYAGLKFDTKQVHRYAYDLNNTHPYAKILDEKEWKDGLMSKYKVEINIPEQYISEIKNLNNLRYLSLFCDDHKGKPCYRKDIKENDLLSLNSKYYIEASMESQPFLVSFVPNTKDDGFGNRYIIKNFRVLK